MKIATRRNFIGAAAALAAGMPTAAAGRKVTAAPLHKKAARPPLVHHVFFCGV